MTISADHIAAIEPLLLQLIEKDERMFGVGSAGISKGICALCNKAIWAYSVRLAQRSYTAHKCGCGRLSNIVQTTP